LQVEELPHQDQSRKHQLLFDPLVWIVQSYGARMKSDAFCCSLPRTHVPFKKVFLSFFTLSAMYLENLLKLVHHAKNRLRPPLV